MFKVFINRTFLVATLTMIIVALSSQDVFAARGGGVFNGDSAIGVGVSLITANQKDLNSVMDATATQYPGAFSTKNIGSAYEFYAEYNFRFSSSMMGLVFRPSYFMQSSTGSCGNGDCDYKLSGFTFFPILRITPLENSFIKFYLQAGIGYGQLSGDVSEGGATSPAKVSFSGSAFGEMAGIGVNFCFTPAHCLTLEGNARYLPIERNVASSASGSFYGGGFSQAQNGREIEYNGNDLSTTMSGLQAILGYTMNF